MAYLSNDGDLQVDVVLTDEGRRRLAKGDGSFKITKFALGDDEINYALYDPNHALGTAYYDLQILQTPILEAFTNNASSMKSKLMTIPKTDILYLPILALNEAQGSTDRYASTETFLITVDEVTKNALGPADGILNGWNPGGTSGVVHRILVDQGLMTQDPSFEQALDKTLEEGQYIVEMDNRLGSLIDGAAGTAANPSYIDDDNMASYYLSTTDSNFVKFNGNKKDMDGQVITGPRGTQLLIAVKASLSLSSNTYWFLRLGGGNTTTNTPGGVSCYYIDSIIRVTGASTGAGIDIPVRYVKKVV